MNTKHKKCLDYSLAFSAKEKMMIQDINKWLPDLIIDTHTHLTPSSCVEDIPPEIQKQMCATFTFLSIKESEKIKSDLYPNKEIISLRMAMPFKGIDHRNVNTYLSESSSIKNQSIFCGIPDDVDYTVNGMRSEKFKALKMYPFYFINPDGSIYQYFKPEILKEANDLSLPIILHLPTKVTSCLSQLEELLSTFPKLPVVLAHMGREREYSAELGGAYSILKEYPNLFIETSTIPSIDVFKSALENFGENRIIFGSDEPYNLIRATVVSLENKRQRFLTTYNYNWVDKEEQKKLSLQFPDKSSSLILMHFQNLYALKESLDQTFLSAQDRERVKNKIFSVNAANIFKIAISSISRNFHQ